MAETPSDKLKDEFTREQAAAGLCADCRYAQKVKSDRGSNFYLCQRSFTDPAFAKYPALPVRKCPGYERANA